MRMATPVSSVSQDSFSLDRESIIVQIHAIIPSANRAYGTQGWSNTALISACDCATWIAHFHPARLRLGRIMLVRVYSNCPRGKVHRVKASPFTSLQRNRYSNADVPSAVIDLGLL